jgi:hypothetical protein
MYGWCLDMPVRWNSTYEFLLTALKMKTIIKKFVLNDDDLGEYVIDNNGWEKIKIVADYLSVIILLTLDF